MNIYIDMDGTLNIWRSNCSIEEITSPGFFRSAVPCENMVTAIREMIKEHPEHDYFILSSTFSDNHSGLEKIDWNKEFIPEMPEDHIILTPYGQSKALFVDSPEDAVLLDDNTDVLLSWPGIGIKVYNNVNGTKGRWTGYSVHSAMKSELLKNQLLGILNICESKKNIA